jgi:hypothetical protein
MRRLKWLFGLLQLERILQRTQILFDRQEILMATLQQVLDKVAKLNADFDAYAAAHQTSEAADLDQIAAAVDAVDAKVTPAPVG